MREYKSLHNSPTVWLNYIFQVISLLLIDCHRGSWLHAHHNNDSLILQPDFLVPEVRECDEIIAMFMDRLGEEFKPKLYGKNIIWYSVKQTNNWRNRMTDVIIKAIFNMLFVWKLLMAAFSCMFNNSCVAPSCQMFSTLSVHLLV